MCVMIILYFGYFESEASVSYCLKNWLPDLSLISFLGLYLCLQVLSAPYLQSTSSKMQVNIISPLMENCEI